MRPEWAGIGLYTQQLLPAEHICLGILIAPCRVVLYSPSGEEVAVWMGEKVHPKTPLTWVSMSPACVCPATMLCPV